MYTFICVQYKCINVYLFIKNIYINYYIRVCVFIRPVRFIYAGSVLVGFNCENSNFGFFDSIFLMNNCFSFFGF